MQNQFVENSQNMLGQVSNRFNSVLDNTESGLGNLLNNTYVSVSLKVFLALYAAFVAPQVSKNFAIFMDSTIVYFFKKLIKLGILKQMRISTT